MKYIDGNGRPDSMETERFQRVLQGQELVRSRIHGVPCSHPSDTPRCQGSYGRRLSADMWNCKMNDAMSGPQHRNITGFAYQSLGFSESVKFSEVLQGQEMSQVVPSFTGVAFNNGTQNGRVRSFDVHRSDTTQGYALQQFNVPATEVHSPSSVLMFNQTMVPQPELDGVTNREEAYGCGYSSIAIQRETEPWSCLQQQRVSENGREPLDTTEASAPATATIAKSGSVDRGVGRSSCKLFGFFLNEKILGTDRDNVKEGNYEADQQTPRVLDLFGHGHSTPGALHALCAAPLGI